MKRKKIYRKRKNGFPALVLFMCGFLAGNLIPNLLWRMEWQQKTMASVYFLGTFADRKLSGAEYMKEILRIRGSCYLLYAVCGFTVFGVPLSVVGAILLGVETGALLAMSVLEFGFSGGLLGIGLLFPQYFIYLPVMLVLMTWVYEMSLEIWKNRGLFSGKTGRYVLKVFLCMLVYTAGMVLECYLNPWIVEKVIELTKIF